MKFPLALCCLLALGVACKKKAPADQAASQASAAKKEVEKPKAYDLEDPETCAPCHDQVVKEFQESMHARAHPTKDPIYGGILKLRAEKEGKGIGKMCIGCHSPRSADPNDDKSIYGVSCASCHNVKAIDRSEGKKGRAALVLADANTLLGPNDLSSKPNVPHGLGAAPAHMKTGSELCLACHGDLSAPSGTPLCTTGAEFEAAKSDQRCVDCHMAETKGPSGAMSARATHRSHNFAGPHRAFYQNDKTLFLTSVDLQTKLEGNKLIVKLTNKTAHSYPTGFPGRFVAVQTTARDQAEKEIWQNFQDNPMKESPESVFAKVYVDEKGNPTLAAFAKSLKRDSRLKPGETRTLEFTVPEKTDHVITKVFFRLVAPPLVKKLGLEKRKEGRGKVAALKVVRRAKK